MVWDGNVSVVRIGSCLEERTSWGERQDLSPEKTWTRTKSRQCELAVTTSWRLRTLVSMLGEDDIVAGELTPQLRARVKNE